jgi:hypothetical protein
MGEINIEAGGYCGYGLVGVIEKRDTVMEALLYVSSTAPSTAEKAPDASGSIRIGETIAEDNDVPLPEYVQGIVPLRRVTFSHACLLSSVWIDQVSTKRICVSSIPLRRVPECDRRGRKW